MRHHLKYFFRCCFQLKTMAEKVTAPLLGIRISSYIVLQKRFPKRMLILEKTFIVDMKKGAFNGSIKLLLEITCAGEARKLREKFVQSAVSLGKLD